MAQGKIKNKTKTTDLKLKQKQKGTPFHRRANAPVKPKKSKHTESQKLKQIITKTVNKSVESEMRSRAKPDTLNLSKAQETVKKYTEKNDLEIQENEKVENSSNFI